MLTLHRPASVDDSRTLKRTLSAVERIGAELPVIFPVHPRTRKNLQDDSAGRNGSSHPSSDWLRLLDPLGYLDFLNLFTMLLSLLGGREE